MDKKLFTDTASKLHEIGKAISKLPPEIRALAFSFLSDYALSGDAEISVKKGSQKSKSFQVGSNVTIEKFFTTHGNDDPINNVKAIAAYLYSEYGLTPIKKNHLREMADKIGITIPNRPDMTIRVAKDNGKVLFKGSSAGFVPTVTGELYLQKTYGIKKGNKQREQDI